MTGPAIREPKNLRIRIGTPLSHLVDFCGGLVEEPGKIILGGPMMGFTQLGLCVPATRGTSGLLLLRHEDVDCHKEGPCIRCSRCVQACPMNLLPTTIAAYARRGLLNETAEYCAMDCIECGSCSYVCPSTVPCSGDSLRQGSSPRQEEELANIVSQQLYLSSSPHIHSGETTPKVMQAVIYSLLPACGVAVYFFGPSALTVLLIATLGCLATEVVCQRLMGQPVTIADGSAAITGILLALNLPPTSPWWLTLLGAIIAIGIGKQVYGGLGSNPFNPALVARVVLLISFPVQMTTWSAPAPLGAGLDLITTATPLGEWKNAVMLTGQMPGEMQGSLTDYFLGNMAGCIGEVSALALLLGAAYLFYRRILTWHIPTAFVGTVVLLSGVFWLIDPVKYPNPVFHLVTGGLVLGAFYMATDMVTTPVSTRGMLLFGVGCGLLTVLIRLFGGYPEGVSFAILLMNAATPLIDRYTRPRTFGISLQEGAR